MLGGNQQLNDMCIFISIKAILHPLILDIMLFVFGFMYTFFLSPGLL